MSRTLQKLAARQVATLKEPGRYSDGGGLYLSVSPAAKDGAVNKKWAFIFTRAGKKREMGFGSTELVSLADARSKADAARRLLEAGLDPIDERDRLAAEAAAPKVQIPLFGDFADDYVDQLAPGFRNAKHLEQWRMTLREYAKPLRSKPVDTIDTVAVLAVLKPIWLTKPETAKRLQGRIERVLDAARAVGHRSGENPARWRGHLDKLLPKQDKLSRGHHAAMAYTDVPTLFLQLADSTSVSAAALEFLILSAARSGEVLGAKWSEVDLQGKVWTVPAVRMKAKRQHRVPLTDRMIEVLNRMAPLREALDGDGFVFPSTQKGKGGISATALLKAPESRIDSHATLHGFRSAFRDWAAEETPFAREVAEAALAHVIGDATERAYRRGDALEKRRQLMRAWEQHCLSANDSTNVIALGA